MVLVSIPQAPWLGYWFTSELGEIMQCTESSLKLLYCSGGSLGVVVLTVLKMMGFGILKPTAALFIFFLLPVVLGRRRYISKQFLIFFFF